jgi:hypothetical protein
MQFAADAASLLAEALRCPLETGGSATRIELYGSSSKAERVAATCHSAESLKGGKLH